MSSALHRRENAVHDGGSLGLGTTGSRFGRDLGCRVGDSAGGSRILAQHLEQREICAPERYRAAAECSSDVASLVASTSLRRAASSRAWHNKHL